MKTSIWMTIAAGLLVLAGQSTASTLYEVTTNSAAGVVTSNYDSINGLSQHIGTCFVGPGTAQGPCGTVSSNPASNILGLTAASTAATTQTYDPQNGVYGSASASAYANLATGTLGTSVFGPQCSPATPTCADGGSTAATMQDTVTFFNTTGQTVFIPITWSFDGAVASNAVTPAVDQYTIISTFCIASGNICAFGNNPNEFQFINSSGAVTNTLPTTGWVASSVTPGMNATSETFQGTFAVASGTSTDFLIASLQLHCVVEDCDFSHTGSLSFGTLPTGLSFTSGSGVLLTQTTPEPGSALLIACGIALMAASRLRSRRSLVDHLRPKSLKRSAGQACS
jgi:hypothetical protein